MNTDLSTILSLATQYQTIVNKRKKSTDSPATKIFLTLTKEGMQLERPSFLKRIFYIPFSSSYRFIPCAEQLSQAFASVFKQLHTGALQLNSHQKQEIYTFANWYQNKIDRYKESQNIWWKRLFKLQIAEDTIQKLSLFQKAIQTVSPTKKTLREKILAIQTQPQSSSKKIEQLLQIITNKPVRTKPFQPPQTTRPIAKSPPLSEKETTSPIPQVKKFQPTKLASSEELNPLQLRKISPQKTDSIAQYAQQHFKIVAKEGEATQYTVQCKDGKAIIMICDRDEKREISVTKGEDKQKAFNIPTLHKRAEKEPTSPIPEVRKPTSQLTKSTLTIEELNLLQLREIFSQKTEAIAQYVRTHFTSIKEELAGEQKHVKHTIECKDGQATITICDRGEKREVYVSEYITRGGFKQLFRRAILSQGRWQTYAYLKPLTKKNKEELENELRFAPLFVDTDHIVHMHKVTKHRVLAQGNEPIQPETKGILMEFYEGGDCRQFLGKGLPFKEKLEIGRQMAQAVANIHDKSVCHVDIKPENFLVKEHQGKPWIALTDFGISGLTGEKKTARTGTHTYSSPEQKRATKSKPYALQPSSDIFSLGLTLIALFHGAHLIPFGIDKTKAEKQLKDLIQNIALQIRSTEKEEEPSRSQLNDLLISMIQYQADGRPTAKKVLETLESSC